MFSVCWVRSRESSRVDPHDLNNDEYFRTINSRFPPTASNRVSNSLSQKSPLSPHRDSLKFTYVTNIRQRTASVAQVASNISTSSTITTIPEAPPLPSSLNTAKPKASWPSPPAGVNNNSSNTSALNTSDSSTTSISDLRRRKLSSSDAKSPKKDNESQQQSFDLSDSSFSSLSTSTPSIHFIQRTLNQHALQTIVKGRLRHLGYMSANITDFDLLNWLKTHKYERDHSSRLASSRSRLGFRHETSLAIGNFPETLKALHKDFHWPLPLLVSPNVYFNPIYRSFPIDNDQSSVDRVSRLF